ncbi:UNVERIFIED_CONTAM: protein DETOXIFICATION 42 [Sesamum calycinum]|uniref:Protein DETOXIFICATION 42 n=1 Tax=Sesamum calycinum TaxID=2727403 RepID=A0AAW2SA02_9LAMI
MGEKGATFSDGRSIPLFIFFKDFRSVFKLDELGLEITRIALPAALALTADPVASLVDTAFIGQIGNGFNFYVVTLHIGLSTIQI